MIRFSRESRPQARGSEQSRRFPCRRTWTSRAERVGIHAMSATHLDQRGAGVVLSEHRDDLRPAEAGIPPRVSFGASAWKPTVSARSDYRGDVVMDTSVRMATLKLSDPRPERPSGSKKISVSALMNYSETRRRRDRRYLSAASLGRSGRDRRPESHDSRNALGELGNRSIFRHCPHLRRPLGDASRIGR